MGCRGGEKKGKEESAWLLVFDYFMMGFRFCDYVLNA